MALLQAILAFMGRAAGRILNAIFGWAVRALFGATSGSRQRLLTGLVALAALWPLLVVGVAAPRVAAFFVAFVPIPGSISDDAIRWTWIDLALISPALVGVALALNAPPEAEREPALVRAATR